MTDRCDTCGGPFAFDGGPFCEACAYGDCAECGGPVTYLGVLGRRKWFRCIDCGIDQTLIPHTQEANQ